MTALSVDAVRDACLSVDADERHDGPLVRRVLIKREFTCQHRCVHGSDRCNGPGSAGYHGIGCRRLEFGVSVDGRGGVSLDLFTPIYPEGVISPVPWSPLGALDFHYADPAPEYLRNLGWDTEKCAYTGGRCWSDVTFQQAETGVEALLRGGVTGVWSWLAEAHLPTVMGAAS